MRGGVHTYCTVSRLGLIPVVGREVMEPVEDVLIGDVCQAGWRVGPGDESGSRGGHGCLGVVWESAVRTEGYGVGGGGLFIRRG